jgi:hypothetical protein
VRSNSRSFVPKSLTVLLIFCASLILFAGQAMTQKPSDEQLEDALYSCLKSKIDKPDMLGHSLSRGPYDYTRAYDRNTGRNFFFDKDKKAWIDAKTGEAVTPTNLEDALYCCLFQKVDKPDIAAGLIVGHSLSRGPYDYTRAYDRNTGRNFFYDASKPAWIDSKTGECVCPKCPCPTDKSQDDSFGLTPGSAPKVNPKTEPGFKAEIKNPLGLNTVIFTTPKNNRIELYLPRWLFAGKTFSATMKPEPSKNPSDQNELNGYSLALGGQQLPLNAGLFTLTLPNSASDTVILFLVDKKGKEKVGVSLPVYLTRPVLPNELDLPMSGTSGDLLVVRGPIEGGIEQSDYIKLSGKPIQLLAKSLGQLVALNTNNVAGLTEIECKTNGMAAKSPFRNLTLKLSADKYELIKGEGTTVHIIVGGLEGITEPAKMTIVTSGTVNMAGGNSQALSISPGEVKQDGTYATDRGLQSYAAGSFGVTVTVTVNRPCADNPEPPKNKL